MAKRGVPLDSLPNDEENRFVKAYRKIDWGMADQLKHDLFVDGFACLQPPQRILALIILKKAMKLKANALLERWIETPSMQFFTGEDWFHWDLPITADKIVQCEARLSSKATAFIENAIRRTAGI